MSVKKPKFKIFMETPKPGQSQEDLIRELKKKHGEGNGMEINAENMSPEVLKATLAGLGMNPEDIEAVLSGKEPAKKPGIFTRITNALLE
jgi:cobalamin biosynthesis protein CbiG